MKVSKGAAGKGGKASDTQPHSRLLDLDSVEGKEKAAILHPLLCVHAERKDSTLTLSNTHASPNTHNSYTDYLSRDLFALLLEVIERLNKHSRKKRC